MAGITRILAALLIAALAASRLAADAYVDRLGHLRLDEVQFIATHNSYHLAPPWPTLALLATSGYQAGEPWPGPLLARAIDYTHLPLEAQLTLGLRAFELDVHDDPAGGRFAGPGAGASAAARGWPAGQPVAWQRAMAQPGFKVFHHDGYDQGSHCWRLADCLGAVSDWSARHPRHAPIVLFIEVKTGTAPPLTADYPRLAPRAFDRAGWLRLERELVDHLGRAMLFTPDQWRAQPLRAWPTLRALAGRIVVMLLDSEAAASDYTRALHGAGVMFTAERPEAGQALRFAGEAWAVLTDPDDRRHAAAHRRALLTFTRADADTTEARSGDGTRRDAAFASGATFISTDYPYPDRRLSPYAVTFGPGVYLRCNPVRAQCKTGEAGEAGAPRTR